MQNRGISRCVFIKIVYFDNYSLSDGNKLLDYPSIGWCTFSMFLDRLLVADSGGYGDPSFSNLLKTCNMIVGHI